MCTKEQPMQDSRLLRLPTDLKCLVLSFASLDESRLVLRHVCRAFRDLTTRPVSMPPKLVVSIDKDPCLHRTQYARVQFLCLHETRLDHEWMKQLTSIEQLELIDCKWPEQVAFPLDKITDLQVVGGLSKDSLTSFEASLTRMPRLQKLIVDNGNLLVDVGRLITSTKVASSLEEVKICPFGLSPQGRAWTSGRKLHVDIRTAFWGEHDFLSDLVSDDDLKLDFAWCPNVTSLVVQNMDDILQGMNDIRPFPPSSRLPQQLQELTVFNMYINWNDLFSLDHLTSLHLRSSTILYTRQPKDGVGQTRKTFPRLTTLEIVYCNMNDHVAFFDLVDQTCPDLQVFEYTSFNPEETDIQWSPFLSRCTRVKLQSYSAILPASEPKVCATHLTHLTMEGVDVGKDLCEFLHFLPSSLERLDLKLSFDERSRGRGRTHFHFRDKGVRRSFPLLSHLRLCKEEKWVDFEECQLTDLSWVARIAPNLVNLALAISFASWNDCIWLDARKFLHLRQLTLEGSSTPLVHMSLFPSLRTFDIRQWKAPFDVATMYKSLVYMRPKESPFVSILE